MSAAHKIIEGLKDALAGNFASVTIEGQHWVRREWQPIETCPKDGTWFLICRDEDGFDSYEVGRYDPYLTPEYIEVGDGLFRKNMRSSYDWSGFNNIHRATHWMPLPTPPVTPPDGK